MLSYKVIFCHLLNPISDTQCDFHSDAALILAFRNKSKRWVVKEILKESQAIQKYPRSKAKWIDHKGKLVIPGLYDLHFHWVQDDVSDMKKSSLISWLNKYTFPNEKKYANKSFTKKKAKEFFQKLSQQGIIGGACYSSIHENALVEAMKLVRGHFIIGNVMMNINSPAYLTQSEEDSIIICEKMATRYRKRYVITPRFALSTTMKVMKKTGEIANKYGLFKQSHLSETPEEIKAVLKEHPCAKTYTEIYHQAKMLGPKSLMAHCIHLNPSEYRLLAKTKTKIIHCPTSNAPVKEKGLGSGLFDFKKAEKYKIDWALGSDIGAGPYLSMFDVMDSFVKQNKNNKSATYTKAIYRCTLKSAQILGLKRHGNFSKGFQGDFLVLNFSPQIANKECCDAEEVLFKLMAKFKKRCDYLNIVALTYLNSEIVARRNLS